MKDERQRSLQGGGRGDFLFNRVKNWSIDSGTSLYCRFLPAHSEKCPGGRAMTSFHNVTLLNNEGKLQKKEILCPRDCSLYYEAPDPEDEEPEEQEQLPCFVCSLIEELQTTGEWDRLPSELKGLITDDMNGIGLRRRMSFPMAFVGKWGLKKNPKTGKEYRVLVPLKYSREVKEVGVIFDVDAAGLIKIMMELRKLNPNIASRKKGMLLKFTRGQKYSMDVVKPNVPLVNTDLWTKYPDFYKIYKNALIGFDAQKEEIINAPYAEKLGRYVDLEAITEEGVDISAKKRKSGRDEDRSERSTSKTKKKKSRSEEIELDFEIDDVPF
jgi:hypothetical protein